MPAKDKPRSSAGSGQQTAQNLLQSAMYAPVISQEAAHGILASIASMAHGIRLCIALACQQASNRGMKTNANLSVPICLLMPKKTSWGAVQGLVRKLPKLLCSQQCIPQSFVRRRHMARVSALHWLVKRVHGRPNIEE